MGKPKKDFKNSIDGRIERQKSEGYKDVSTNLSGDRFSEEKQVASADQLGVSKKEISDPAGKPVDPMSTAAKEIKGKIKIRPDVSVDELDGKQVGGVPLVGNMALLSVAGASSLSPADDMSRTPYSAGGYRPESRYGKKRSEDLFMLDNQVTEQTAPKVEDSLDLKEAPEAVQGYNGRKQFTQTRGKKNFKFVNNERHDLGKLPQQLLNDASVDFIHTSKVVYTCGQMINGTSDSSAYATQKGSDYPLNTHAGTPVANTMHKSNYKLKALNITTIGNKITGISFDEDEYMVHADPLARDQANMNMQVDSNNIAKAMVRLQKELGRETSEKWSPLGYVAKEGYEYNTLCHDIEATTAAIMAIGYRASVSSLAWQRNIAGKDGVNPQRNAIRMVYEGAFGPFANSDTASITDTDFKHILFSKSAYQKAAVTGIIDMFDSTGKYRTKADILGLQRGLSLHLSTCDNNLNPLHVKPEFLKALNKAHMFSTPTGEYNPYLPIYSTRTISIINPLSLNLFVKGWKNPALLTAEERNNILRDADTGTLANYSYSYNDLRNNTYVQRVQHPVVEGLIRWLLKHEGAFCATFGNDNGEENTVTIPAVFNFESPSLFQFMLCSASQDVLWERNIIFRDILFAGEQSTYIWDDLKGLNELDPLYSTQLKINGYDQALTLGKLSVDTMIRELWSDHMPLTVYSNGKAQYMLPWYFNEQSFGSTAGGSFTYNEGFYDGDRAFNMSIPSIRDGVRHEYVDVIKSVSERDVRLAMDRRVAIPQFVTATPGGIATTYSNYNDSSVLNSNVKLSTIRYDGNSDGRVIAVYDMTDGVVDRVLSSASLYCCPKELGWIDDDYAPMTVINYISWSQANGVLVNSRTLHSEDYADGAYHYNGYSPLFITSYRVSADSPNNGSIDRSAALTQVFYNCFASQSAQDIDEQYILKTGIIPALSYNDGLPVEIYAVYNLGSDHESTSAEDKTIRSMAHRIWSMIQRFFLPVNRFENVFSDRENVDYDMFEESFYFGLCGFLASDYTQDVLERLDTFDQLNLDYTEDTFVKDSLIFRQD